MTQPTIPASSDHHAPLHGVLAEFDGVGPLMQASARVRDAGYRKWDTHTPFPVHGLDAAMGIKPTKLPWIVLLCGLIGMASAILMQWWMNAYDYQFRISGKPIFSLPANIPVAFELTVLLSGFACFFGSLGMNKLPELFNPIFHSERFKRATSDRFFVYVEAADPAFNLRNLQEIFQAAHALNVETIEHDERSPASRLPKGLVGVTSVLTVLTLVPLGLIARARETTSELPRIHVLPDDMDSQYKHKAQAANWFFSDGRAMRAPPEGTVAREDNRTSDVFFTGKAQDGNWAGTFPPAVTVSDGLMQRGRERFGVYCAPCHGLSGKGDGLVTRHADRLMEGTWVTPSNMHDERVRKLADGDIFNTISNGVRNMPGYAHQIGESDRWAIVLYVRALQLSQNAPRGDVPAEVLPTLQ